MTDDELERLLDLAAAEARPLSPRFLGDALTMALAEQPAARAVTVTPRGARRIWHWRLSGQTGRGGADRSRSGLGGVMAGLVIVAVLGGVIGYADPGAVAEELLAWPDPALELVPVIEPFLAET